MVGNARHAGRNRNLFQFFAAIEGIVSDTRHSIGDHGVLTACYQRVGCLLDDSITIVAAVVYRIVGCHRDRFQTDAIYEGPVADTRHAGRDGDAGQTSAVTEGLISDGRHVGRDIDAGQIDASIEGSITDGRHAGRNLDAGQAPAALEGIVADGLHAGRNLDAGQTGAEAEGIVADARHTIADVDRRDVVKIIFPVITLEVIRHVPSAKDGECITGAIVRPIHISAAGATGLYNIFVCCPVAGCLIGLCGASRYVDISEGVAIVEYIVAQRGRGCRFHEDRGQGGAATEGIVADARHTFGNGDAGQTGAFIEGLFADARHTRGYHGVLTAKQQFITFFYYDGIAAVATVVYRISFSYRNRSQAKAVCEGLGVNPRHAGRDGNAGQASTCLKGLFANGRQAGREFDTAQGGAE